ncbi:hypothetical protein ACEWY4_013748 [Coilia grayii]|uniref:Uncharacterized protein n=1 Tax=Coilia grayii TaxID=363190 RepID=A0ABD1JXD9_9TELE
MWSCNYVLCADFEKKAKKELSPVLEQFLCHVAKTGETLVPWSQFKSYFIFKLEKVMDDFRATAPEQRGPANPNVECIPFEEMKTRILKIVNGYTGIPFTIQRLCELLTEPKRNYTGTEKFLRGVEKNVMVVSCVHPTSEKNGCSGVNRMNGVMLPGNASAFAERKVNGPGTPRPLNRQKVSLASSLATNGLPDSTENKDPNTGSGHSKPHSETSPSGPSRVLTRSKHPAKEEEDSLEEEQPEVKRLKFLKDGEDAVEEEDDDEEEEEEEEADDAAVETLRPALAESSSDAKQALAESSMSPEKQRDEELEEEEEDSGPASSTAVCQDQEPSSTQSEPCAEESKAEEKEAESEADSEQELPSGSTDSPSEPTDMDQSEQSAASGSGSAASPESREAGDENSEHVSSSSSSSSSCSEESEESTPAATSSDSTTEPPTEGAPESAAQDSASAEEPMEVD